MSEHGQGPEREDVYLLEAALHHAGSCHRYDLAAALDFSLARLAAACAHLAARLEGTAVQLAEDDGELCLSLRTDALDEARRTRLEERARQRTALSAAEAGRLVECIALRLTGPAPTALAANVTDLDQELVTRGVLEFVECPGSWHAVTAEPHPDALFALGLCDAPNHTAAPPHPPDPALRSAADAL